MTDYRQIQISEATNVRRQTETSSHQSMSILMSFNTHSKLSSLKSLYYIEHPIRIHILMDGIRDDRIETWDDTEGKAKKFLLAPK